MAGGALVLYNDPNDVNSKQIVLAQVAKDLKRKRAVGEAKKKKKEITTGALNFIPVLFTYAGGKQSWVHMPKDAAKKFGIVKAPEGTLSANGIGVTHNKTKEIKVSYGFKIVTRKVAKKANSKVVKRGGNGKETQTRAYISLSIPSDATFLDAINFCRNFPKVPGLLKYSPKREFIFDYKRAIGGAGAVK